LKRGVRGGRLGGKQNGDKPYAGTGLHPRKHRGGRDPSGRKKGKIVYLTRTAGPRRLKRKSTK